MIDARPEDAWAALTDVVADPGWKPVTRKISGTLVRGNRWTVALAPPGGRATTMHPTLPEVRPERVLS